jgi:hypothetical protein
VAADNFDYQFGRFTGSSANVMMNGDEAAINRHVRARLGLDPPEPPNWAMRAGSHMESLILDWYQEKIGHPIIRRGEVVYHPDDNDVCVKLDGFCAELDLIIEAKFLSPQRRREEFIPAYYAQTALQRMCTRASNVKLLVAQGTAEPIDFDLDQDAEYDAELWRRKDIFLGWLRTMTQPYPLPPVVPQEKWRTIDIIAEPTNWSGELLLYLQEYDATAEAATSHDAAGKAARDLIPDDVGKCFAGAFQISRNRKGTLAITRRAA